MNVLFYFIFTVETSSSLREIRSLRILIHPVYAYIEVDRKRSIHPEISLGGKVAANTLWMLSIPFRYSHIFALLTEQPRRSDLL